MISDKKRISVLGSRWVPTRAPRDCSGCLYLDYHPETTSDFCEVYRSFLNPAWIDEITACLARKRVDAPYYAKKLRQARGGKDPNRNGVAM